MATARFEHFLTFLDGATIDEHIEWYRKAGFNASDQAVRHDPGLRNGFVHLGPDYFEFCWVEDEAMYAKGGDPLSEPPMRQARRPYSIGMMTYDLEELREGWVERGFEMPPITSGVPRDAPAGTPPRWSFMEIPDELTPGARCFALVYHLYPKGTPRKVRPGANSTYAVAGVTFVSERPEERAEQWRDLLEPDAAVAGEDNSCSVRIGPHHVTWITPQRYRELFGLEWPLPTHPFGEMAAFHLPATDLGTAEAMLAAAGRSVRRLKGAGDDDTLLVHPDPRDGFMFVISEMPIEQWREARTAATGELLEIV